MSYIFIDESGDLGTKKLSSRYFVIAASKTKKSLRKKIITNEIKGSKLPKEIKFALFNRLNNIDYEVFIIIFEKIYRYKVPSGYDNKKLYDILSAELAKEINIDGPTEIYIDKSKNKPFETIKLNHANSMNFKGLQIADLISWATFQSVENNNSEFFDLLENKKIKRVFEDEKNL